MIANLDDLQTCLQELLQNFPEFKAKNVKAVIDDGNYPKLPEMEKALQESGLVLVVWEIGVLGATVAENGTTNMTLHLPIVIKENIKKNKDQNGTGIKIKTAMTYVIKALSGQPKASPSANRVLTYEAEPFDTLETVNGIRTTVVNFTKKHCITT